ncbi:MAG TPA: carboxymuconolactone decarboxylase family protein [Sphingobacterium sp.]|jgi:uncharacterized peroxidase-related enzyme|uniref:carboxymuconolactone decarboxylase family protein n=1 Tax=Bacteroidota TaxID=976 RepID=UPI0008A4C341|nr:carboxymuconolactone decarboxylase family protein [Sphingobacterium sp. HMSC13C05]MBX2977306.1 carboxymuconolactone decarboxylase family protein [Ignavibacteriaceae bacterium]OFV19237.1 alkylhydroperoxidase [Sphingobacterium sp. HMSC13C05]SJN19936.1 Alkylhydroperoxidase AhpD core domain [Sphingobacterium faecium PCAi_F2.5]HCU45417.1 carboxymuconolactone decarboxylase family protein [Sphingobacterium sp.]
MKNKFSLLSKEEISSTNREIFDKMEKSFGKVPNLYNIIAYSENALGAYMKLEETPNSLTIKEVEAINLVVSQVNSCVYCLSAHTIVAKSIGINDEEAIEIRKGGYHANEKLDALVKITNQITEKRGHVDVGTLDAFFKAGYTKGNLVDIIVIIGDRTISNLLHAVTQVPVDFPLAKNI